jgi:V/A-type H+-transporting ATPase subunit D
MPKIIEGVHLTRMDLLKIKNRTRLATKGHKLLREKRDALIAEFFKVIDKAKGIREELSGTLSQGRINLVKAKALMGSSGIETIAESIPPTREIEFSFQNIMGVKIPKLVKEEGEELKYTLIFMTPKLEEAMKNFSSASRQLIRLIESEETVRRVGSEIKKVKRRTNALEYILIPNLDYTRRYIEFRLQEIERENFFRLKIIKKKKMRK